MREIKFRGKRLDNGAWRYGYLFRSWDRVFILWGMTNDSPNMVEVDPATVGQFVGLYSADLDFIEFPNKEAYFGDIIKYVDTDGTIHIHTLSWNNDLYCVMVGNIPYVRLYDSGYIQPSKLQFEIIGNIHDNPELLKTE